MEKNQFRLADVILSVICVVFVAEAAAPVASIGNSQYFWWIFMILAFLLPYGLIAAELGTAYAGDGGLYDWIHAAYPNGKWAARASWYYWINFPLWMASLAVMCPELITFITGRSLGTFSSSSGPSYSSSEAAGSTSNPGSASSKGSSCTGNPLILSFLKLEVLQNHL